MRDPYTLIFSAGPFDLWHRDKDGLDGACGWSAPQLTEKQLKALKNAAWCEAHQPLFMAHYGHVLKSGAEAESLMRGLLLIVAQCLALHVTMDEISRWALELSHSPGNNLRNSLTFLPGYHSNRDENTALERQVPAESLYACVARGILLRRRRWWQHPRWHVWHWRLHVRPFWESWSARIARLSALSARRKS